jgi:hypothetical protein
MPPKKKTKSSETILREVEKEMAKPRLAESVRRAAAIEHSLREAGKR